MSTPERLAELLADQAVWGLDGDEQRELHDVQTSLGVAETDDSWESTAVAIQTAYVDFAAEPPRSLVRKLEAAALTHVFEQRDLELRDVANGTVALAPASEHVAQDAASPARRIEWSWLVAAAAILFAFVVGWERWPASPVSFEEQRTALLSNDPSALQIEWNAGPSELRGDPSGDVIWSSEQQRGFMRFAGLPANDASQRQYQLWIFDKTRDAAKPVDGGVFDVPAGGGDVIVPIHAKIEVREAFAFAVTVEAPGGVVVSDREHIVVTAGL